MRRLSVLLRNVLLPVSREEICSTCTTTAICILSWIWETYDQISLNQDAIGDALKFVKENEVCKICSHNGSVFAVEPPLFVELAITETEPGFKGDTATGANKPATVETGAQVYVPLFVNEGDVIKIDTRTGEYLSRV